MSQLSTNAWTDAVFKAAFVVLAVAAVGFVVWRLLGPLVPGLLVIVALVAVLRLAVRGRW